MSMYGMCNLKTERINDMKREELNELLDTIENLLSKGQLDSAYIVVKNALDKIHTEQYPQHAEQPRIRE